MVDLDGNKICKTNSALREGMTFRCNLDGSDVEVLGNNFRNPFEVAVDSFCSGKISFLQISEVVAHVMNRHELIPAPTLDQILTADAWARTAALG